MSRAKPGQWHLNPGDKVGNYEIVGQVAAGGSSIVYRAKDSLLGREVAIKQILADANDPDIRAAVIKESRHHKKASTANPKHLVQSIELVDDDHGLLLVSEWIDGPTLETLLTELVEPLQIKQAMGVIGAAALALSSLHEQKMVHRDIKPANMLLPRVGGFKLADFGLAETMSDQASLSAGTTRYMAPELLRGEAVDGRADLYSLGMVAYEMLAGQTGFEQAFRSVLRDERNTAIRWVKWHTNPRTAAPPLTELNPNVPQAISDIVARMMDKDPAKRVQTAQQCVTAIGEHMSKANSNDNPFIPENAGESVKAQTNQDAVAKSSHETAPLPQGSRTPAILAIVIGLVLVVGGVLVFQYLRQQNESQQQAQNDARQTYRSGVEHLRAGEYLEAIAVFDDMLANLPESWTNLRGHAEAAKLLAHGHMHRLAGEHRLAIDQFEAVESMQLAKEGQPKIDVEDPEKLRQLIRSSEYGLSFDQTADQIEQWIEEQQLGQARSRLAELQEMASLTAAEQTRLQSLATTLQDQNARAFRQQRLRDAQSLADTGKIQQGIDLLTREMERSPHPDVARLLELLEKQQEVEQAESNASIALAEDNFSDVVKELLKAQNILPTDERASRLRSMQSKLALQQGLEYLRNGEPEEAEVALLRSMQYEETEQAQAALDSIGSSKRQTALIRAGDQAMLSRDYEQALAQYQQALEAGAVTDVLSDKLEQARIENAVALAKDALSKQDPDAASKALEDVDDLAPQDERLPELAQSAESLRTYLGLLAKADEARERSDFGQAKRLYSRAQNVIDTAEIRQRLDLAEYQHLVAQARSYIDAGQFRGARALLQSAARIEPTQEVKDLLEQIAEKP